MGKWKSCTGGRQKAKRNDQSRDRCDDSGKIGWKIWDGKDGMGLGEFLGEVIVLLPAQ